MRPQERKRMHDRVDRPELAPGGRAIERHDDTRDGSLSEPDADEMPWLKVETVGDEVAERLGRTAHACENSDLSGLGGHKS
jgi:hypothetical protein